MKALWIDEGNDPQWEKIEAHGIGILYFSIKDPRVTRQYLESVEAAGLGVGVYVVSGWGGWGFGASLARNVDAQVKKIQAGKTGVNFPRVQFDMEEHNPHTIFECLAFWRSLPGRQYHSTSWTMEPMQGGWMDAGFVKAIVDRKIRVVPQYYGGDMQPFAQDTCFRDLLKRGFPESSISGFYDAKNLPLSWDGFAFTQGRLP